jgi:DNA-binding LacI/PurR family transcriptional regulator
MVALGFIQAAAEESISVPGDVAVVGYDDVAVARYAAVPLTTIHQPVDHIGRLAVEIIQKRIDKSDIGNRTVLKPSLIVRDSCGARKRAKPISQNQSGTGMEELRRNSETGSG